MISLPDFDIRSAGPISNAFLGRDILTFQGAVAFIYTLPYGRNANKKDLATVFSDACGTCSTKHALLKVLAEENGYGGLELILGIYKMNGSNTPVVSSTLEQHGLDYIPEAHNYLRYQGNILDYTFPGNTTLSYEKDLLEEIIIAPYQITDFKVNYHKKFLAAWLKENPHISYNLGMLWHIREQCIQDLSKWQHD